MWMDSFLPMAFFSLFLLTSIFLQASAQQINSYIRQGTSLTPTSKSMWLSPSGLYAFGFYPQSNGFAVGIFVVGLSHSTVVWTANRDDNPVSRDATLQLNLDGLVLQMNQNSETAYVVSVPSASTASMLDSGNFVLYDSNQTIIWQSFAHPTDTILAGQRLLAGKKLISSRSESNHSTGIFRLTMQEDGNLVQYPMMASYPYWASDTYGAGDNVTLNLDTDGHLYLLNNTGVNIKDLSRGFPSSEKRIYLMRIDPDGIFRLYSHDLYPSGNWSTIWSSSGDKCDPKGLCGINAYCVNYDDQVDCKCLPGFEFVNPSRWSSGCERSFIADRCANIEGVTEYTMIPLANIECEDNGYYVLSLSNKEDCEKACLEDCNCEAASFTNGQCKKQRLPLRFGRRLLSSSNVVFIKVGNSTVSPTTNGRYVKRKIQMVILVVSVSIASFALIIFATFGVLTYRNHNRLYKKISEKNELGLSEAVGPRSFTYGELKEATNDFKEELGRGSFGIVYKGTTSNAKLVFGIKKLEMGLEQCEREFQTEIKVIGRTHHRNLVKLHGYCLEGPNRLLVYEYMSRGSLADAIFMTEKKPCWDERIGFARDIARGILYLHEECETQIIHCDIKSQNILLNDYGNAKISDFGMAKLLRLDQINTYTGIRGTKGYVAPEWYHNMPVTVKVDLYSFGILLLEIICCRRNVELSLPEEEVVLDQWVYDCFEAGKLCKLTGDEKVDRGKLERMVKLGLWCIQDDPSLRPSMKKVVLMLEGTVDIPIPPSPTSFLSVI